MAIILGAGVRCSRTPGHTARGQGGVLEVGTWNLELGVLEANWLKIGGYFVVRSFRARGGAQRARVTRGPGVGLKGTRGWGLLGGEEACSGRWGPGGACVVKLGAAVFPSRALLQRASRDAPLTSVRAPRALVAAYRDGSPARVGSSACGRCARMADHVLHRPDEWLASNSRVVKTATGQRELSQSVRSKATSLRKSTSNHLQRTQRDVQNKLSLRIDDIQSFRLDLERAGADTARR